MALLNFGTRALRVTKNYSEGYSHHQIKTRNATCNDAWPPSGKEMFELAQLTYHQGDFIDIMEVIDKRLNDKGKNWRHVFKDYFLHSSSENVILDCEDNLCVIKTLREFQYIDHQQAEYARQQMEEAQAAAHVQLLALQQQQQQQQQQQKGQQPLVPQPTVFGSNNPFVAHPSPPPSPPRDAPVPFTFTGTYDERRRPPVVQDSARLRAYSTGAERRARRRGEEKEDERLARAFAGYEGEGVDTFRNVGQLRCVFFLPFACKFGGTEFGRLAVQRTGAAEPEETNPFLNGRERRREAGRSRDLIDL